MPEADVAILATYEHLQVIREYTRDRALALAGAALITTSPGLDLQRAFFSEPHGAIPFTKGRSGRTIIVFISDLHCPKYNLDFDAFTLECQKNRLSVSSILLGTTDYTGIFKSMASATGGVVRESVSNSADFKIAIEQLWEAVYGDCVIEWTAPYTCDQIHDITIEHKPTTQRNRYTYVIPWSRVVDWSVKPRFVRTKQSAAGTVIDTLLRLQSRLSQLQITSVECDRPEVVLTPSAMVIDTTGMLTVRVQWTKQSDATEKATITIKTDSCSSVSATIVFVGLNDSTAANPIQLLIPNGGEEYIGGTMAEISYDGVPDSTVVRASISIDNGKSWQSVASGTGGKLPLRIPTTPSDSCLARIQSTVRGTLRGVDSIFTKNRHYSGTTSWYLDPLERWILVSTNRQNIEVHDASTMTYLTDLPFDSFVFGSFGSPDDGSFIVFSVNTPEILMLDTTAFSEIRRMTPKLKRGYCPKIDVTPTGERILALENLGGYYTGLTVYDKSGMVIIDTMMNCNDAIIDPSGKILVWVEDNKAVHYNIATGKFANYYATIPNSLHFNKVVLSKDGVYAAIATYTAESYRVPAEFLLIDVASGVELARNTPMPYLPDDRFTHLQFSPDNEKIIVGGPSLVSLDVHSLQLLDSVNWVLTTSSRDRFVNSLDISSDSRYIAYTTSRSDSLFVRSVDDLELVASTRTTYLADHSGVKWSADGAHLYEAYGAMPYSVVKYEFAVIDPSVSIDESDSLWRIISPKIDLRTSLVDMGRVPVGSTKDSIVASVLCNSGDAPLQVTGIDLSSGNRGDFNIPVGGGAFTLAPGECRDIMVEFMPMVDNYREVRGTIKTTIGSLVDTIIIFGNGIRDKVELTADIIDFGRIAVGSTKDTLAVPVVKNACSQVVNIESAVLTGPDASSFSILNLPVTTPLAIDSALRGSIRFNALRAGRHSAWIELRHNGPLGFMRVHLFGEGVASVPMLIGIDTISTLCAATVDTAIQLLNAGEGRLVVSGITVETPVGYQAFSLIDMQSLPIVVWPGDTANLRIRYAPLGAGSHMSNLILSGPGKLPIDSIKIPLHGQSLINGVESFPPNLRVVGKTVPEVIDTSISIQVNFSNDVYITPSVTGQGVALIDPMPFTVNASDAEFVIALRCTVPDIGTSMASVELLTTACNGALSIPIVVVSPNQPPPVGDTLWLSTERVRVHAGDVFMLRTTARVTPSLLPKLTGTTQLDLTFNASITLPRTAQGAMMLNGYDATLAHSMTAWSDPQATTQVIDIPFRGLLGTDSTTRVLPTVRGLPQNVTVVTDTGSVTILDLCKDGGRLRTFDPTGLARPIIVRDGDIIRVTVSNRMSIASRIVLLDIRGASVPIDVDTDSANEIIEHEIDLSTIARGRYQLLIVYGDKLASIPIVR
ncbi:MAG TPA: choice-of-anchor D domain-containing protein [Candidatus Didemnitutus sp.]|nr:choice-of-anchor D domain-containing protein [Candidatus Didemnitutus sp.]